MLKKLKTMLDDHRESSVVTCAPSCMCWSVEGFILVHESQLTPVVMDVAICLCDTTVHHNVKCPKCGNAVTAQRY